MLNSRFSIFNQIDNTQVFKECLIRPVCDRADKLVPPPSPLLHENTLTHLKKYFFIHYKLYEILQSQAVAMFLSFVDLVSLL